MKTKRSLTTKIVNHAILITFLPPSRIHWAGKLEGLTRAWILIALTGNFHQDYIVLQLPQSNSTASSTLTMKKVQSSDSLESLIWSLVSDLECLTLSASFLAALFLLVFASGNVAQAFQAEHIF